jgi:hypothetical protein
MHKEELYELYCSQNIQVIQSRIMRWAGYVACDGERRDADTGLVTKPERESDYFEDLCVDGRIILKWIFKKLDRGMDWIDLAQDSDRWRAVGNAAMNLGVP